VIFPSSVAWPIMRSTRIYRLAMSYNKGLDRDKDGIACEKA
jgi:Excalibur calcium-binding domain